MRWMTALGIAVSLVMGVAACDVVFLNDRPPTCPTAFGASRHLRIDNKLTWDEADASCRQLQVPNSSMYTHLAVISDDAELAELIEFVTLAGTDEMWVGASEKEVAGLFRWITDEDAAIPWAAGQPDDSSTLPQCALLYADGLHDSDCVNVERYICECDELEPVR